MKSNTQVLLQKTGFSWGRLPDFPNRGGLAGAYVGVSHNVLIIAGGTNFPNDTRPWSGGKKSWYDTIYVLEQPAGVWKVAGHLPKASGYGVALSYKNSLLCFGGGDALQHSSACIAISYEKGKIHIASLPDMPVPLVNACGVIIEDKVFIAGGIEAPAGKTTHHFFSLDLEDTAKGWSVLPSLPGASRMLATAGTLDGSFYVFGGVELQEVKGDSLLHRNYLKDGFMYDPGTGWHPVADLPVTLAATPGPAFSTGGTLYLFGGDDGANAEHNNELKDKHPGFSNRVLAYKAAINTWSVAGSIPVSGKTAAMESLSESLWAPVTTPCTIWNDKLIIAGGEVRPGVRTNKVLTVTINGQ